MEHGDLFHSPSKADSFSVSFSEKLFKVAFILMPGEELALNVNWDIWADQEKAV